MVTYVWARTSVICIAGRTAYLKPRGMAKIFIRLRWKGKGLLCCYAETVVASNRWILYLGSCWCCSYTVGKILTSYLDGGRLRTCTWNRGYTLPRAATSLTGLTDIPCSRKLKMAFWGWVMVTDPVAARFRGAWRVTWPPEGPVEVLFRLEVTLVGVVGRAWKALPPLCAREAAALTIKFRFGTGGQP